MFADLYVSSVFGMSGDFDFVMNSWECEARKLAKPITITFIHGADDPLTSPSESRAWPKKATATGNTSSPAADISWPRPMETKYGVSWPRNSTGDHRERHPESDRGAGHHYDQI